MGKVVRKGLAIATAFTVVSTLAGCTGTIPANSKIEPGPVGIGRSVNELKGTPCACTEIEMSIPAGMRA